MPRKAGSSLLKAAQAVVVPEGQAANANPTEKIFVPKERLEEFVGLIETEFPNAVLHERTIAKGGRNAAGDQNVLFAAKQSNPNGMATVWYTGSATLTGEMISLKEKWA